ncbi:breast carcinoma-amplified sequence 1 isoform X2 [Melanotaenia boesemani]|uniref:breast carcinoma-amplified sequence 1 isoform X2 n=1 Tax=Melanotaenia boesemani TaxID=1250792 RepID=UPI001C04234C|nr:breast carcinoma-amplified sequence 1 isoform X2 [Melanotaenia boesemani]
MGNEQSNNIEATQNGNTSEKHENGSVNGLSAKITANGLETDESNITVHQNGKPQSSNHPTNPNEPATVKSDAQKDNSQVILEITSKKEEVKKSKEEKGRSLGKLFKKKADRRAHGEESGEKGKETSGEDQVDVNQFSTDAQQETANLQLQSEPVTEPDSLTADSGPEEDKVPKADHGNGQTVENQEESNPEENPVMNFFKTLVNTTKTPKKETAPEATKDQSLKESQPAAAPTVAQTSEPPAAPKGMPIPPPPPPEPPKMEVKGEAAAKPAKLTAKEEAKAAAKEPEPAKGKSAKDALSKFFRPKGTEVKVSQPVVEVQVDNKVEPERAAMEALVQVVEVQMVEAVPQPVVEAEKVDPSKAGTLEAAAKPEPPPAQEEKKAASKSSLLSIFKPKVLLDHMTTKVQAASTSGVRFLRKTTGLAAEPMKTAPTPSATAEAAAKAKEEPKAAAKSAETVVDNKPASAASQPGEDATSVPKKLEKRNSIQLFFKTLGQKRHSTDAGVQTEPVSVAAAAEKAK